MQTDWRVDHAHRGQLAPHLIERALADLATAQFGAVAHHQLIALGFSARQIDLRLRAGRLRPLYRGVYAVGHDVLTPRGHWMAATLAGGRGTLLSHRAGAALRGLVPPPAGKVDISVEGARGRSFPDLRVHRRIGLTAADRDEIDGIPVTSLARTVLDLAAVRGERAALEACERALELRVFDLGPIAELLERCRGQRGTRPLAAALAQLRDEPDILREELERRLRWLIVSSALPPARHNVYVRGASGRSWECDVVWGGARVIVEADGAAYHATRAARDRDARKQADLEAADWLVLRVGWADVTARAAQTVTRFDATLRERLAS